MEKSEDGHKNLIAFIDKLSGSKVQLKEQCLKIFKENFIETLEDLLNLTGEDIESIGLPLLFKRKFLNELDKLRPKTGLSESDKSIINSFYEKDFSIEDILKTLKIDSSSSKADLVKEYCDSLKKPLKPVPTNLEKLFVKGQGPMLPCFHYPSKEIIGKRYFTLLVMGETGTGKTTLLDAFVNYLAGMNYEDQWRYKLVNENHMKNKKPGESQTTEITSYYVNYQREDENSKEIYIRIIDTPGLGDTSGVLTDNEIIKKFETLFQEIGELDYILVTVVANSTRWTQQTQYVYDRILEVFGVDAVERFMLMCTFSDGNIPLALEVLKDKFKYQDYFCFNNSALYVPSKEANDNTKFFWKLGISNVRKFFDIILEKNLLPLSLSMSKEVMRNRQWLFANVQSSKKRINEAFSLLERSNQFLQTIKKHEKEINENKSFTYQVEEDRTKKIYLNNVYQYCTICGCPCCQICVWPAGANVSQCTYFNGNRRCPICPGHCYRESHGRLEYITEKYTVKVTKTYDAKKQLYDKSKEGLSNSEIALNNQIEIMSNLGKSILKDMDSIKKSLIELDKIALKPRLFTNVDYFNQMIQYEEETKNPGYKGRINGFKMMRDQAIQLNEISNAEDITQLFPQFNNVIVELKKKKSKEGSSSCLIF